jgi:hypothetical protein
MSWEALGFQFGVFGEVIIPRRSTLEHARFATNNLGAL